ncbi:TetR/AcrR family transcriptional regulator [Mycolicibacterium palauense]|uniref:TetR/AcrR family transcriptional regulator n=1 Tax=Mycolicibacterium palauense TaxID=2034511 RepID=UPI000BFEEE01|nr:TetR/AcrR family transcriptional regulator [Mycolicibacterium palauense]
MDAAARTVVARKGILAATVADIAAEAGKSTASFYNYYDSKEDMVRQWALRFRDEAGERARGVTAHGLSDRERVHRAATAHWNTYRHRLAEMISVSQLAMINDDFAQHWAQICAGPVEFITETVVRAQARGHCPGDDPHLLAEAIVSMLNQFCYTQLAGGADPDDTACITTLSNVFYRAVYGTDPPEEDS